MSGPSPPGAVPSVGIGRRFQPVPGGQLVRTEGGDGVARVPVAPGTPVHAVAAGQLLAVGEIVTLRGEDGHEYDYAGVVSPVVATGAAVRAGDIVGAAGLSGIAMRIRDAAGGPVDAVEALVGLPDPNELGYVASGVGQGLDPDALDREIMAAGGGAPR